MADICAFCPYCGGNGFRGCTCKLGWGRGEREGPPTNRGRIPISIPPPPPKEPVAYCLKCKAESYQTMSVCEHPFSDYCPMIMNFCQLCKTYTKKGIAHTCFRSIKPVEDFPSLHSQFKDLKDSIESYHDETLVSIKLLKAQIDILNSRVENLENLEVYQD